VSKNENPLPNEGGIVDRRPENLEMPMRTFTQNEPLTDAELDRLGDFLKSCKGGRAMNVEALDGFFSALIAGPETAMPSEYNREVFGGEMSDACEFGSLDEAREILGLMMRHWNTIAGTLLKPSPQAVAHGVLRAPCRRLSQESGRVGDYEYHPRALFSQCRSNLRRRQAPG
jgi:hypothetical protein